MDKFYAIFTQKGAKLTGSHHCYEVKKHIWMAEPEAGI